MTQQPVTPAQRWTAARPCPVCGGHPRLVRGTRVRCTGFLSEDGNHARCSREERSGPIAAGPDGLFPHLLSGHCPCGTFHVGASPQRAPRPVGKEAKIVATHDYLDENGELLYQVVRYNPKDFRQRRRNGAGGWIWSLGDTRRVLYRLPELLTGTRPVFVVEGEKDADNLAAIGIVATCNPGGAGKWFATDSTLLNGRDVVLLPDADDVGRAHMRDVATSLLGRAASVRVLELPDLPPKGDISDWLAAGGTREELLALAEAAPLEATTAAVRTPWRTSPTTDGTGMVLTNVCGAAAPLSNAGLFAGHLYPGRTLACYQGNFYRYTGTRWEEHPDGTVRAEIYNAFKDAVVTDSEGRAKPFDPNARRVSDILDALRALAHIDHHVAPPAWLDGRECAADGFVAMQNGLLNLATRTLMPHTRELFTFHALPFDYDPDAPEPESWLAFLNSVWEDDGGAIDALQEMFGYIVGGSTRQQKVFLIVGPKRSGKGTIARVLTRLIGQHNSAGISLNSLADRFGIAPLITRPLAVISDARLGAGDTSIVERLLSISGEDLLTVDRKHREAWTGTLPTRFVICTNELPRLADSSGALASRFIVLTMTKSFLGREDHQLTDRLLTELPGILNWSLTGLDRLNARGRFTQPESGDAAVAELNDLSAPISAFLRDRCLVGPQYAVACDPLYRAWRQWCATQGRDHPGNVQTFGKDLRAAIPTLRTTMPRDDDSRQIRHYHGVGLLP